MGSSVYSNASYCSKYESINLNEIFLVSLIAYCIIFYYNSSKLSYFTLSGFWGFESSYFSSFD